MTREPRDRPSRHEGEEAVQRRAGEYVEGRGSPMFGSEISASFAAFLRRQVLLVVGAPDPEGAVWCSALTGAAGFVNPLDARTIAIHALPPPGDPLAALLTDDTDVGLLAIEPWTRRRIRVNGRARRAEGRLMVRTEQVLGNCPKYIHRRAPAQTLPATPGTAARTGSALTADQRAWITGADTFFVASHSLRHGADASHRGGPPGFVTATSPRRLTWPDFVGNSFYMSLGNIALNPAAGLLFLDWEHGHALHLSGRARIDWDAGRELRLVRFDVQRVVQVDGSNRLRWSD